MVNLRPLTAEDLSDLVQLKDCGDWSLAQIVRQLAHPRGISLGVFTPKLVGFIFISTVLDEAELLQIGIMPECRGAGLAGQLITACLPLLKGQAVERLMLEVRESNTAARSLYQRFGFVEEGRRKNYYPVPNSPDEREDALLLSLML